jgi:outer membrane protein OmpA-like peptidoglycan-associated protein/N-acetylneuraminic acid mutarotase
MRRFFRYLLFLAFYSLFTLSLSAQNKELVWENKAAFPGGKIKGEATFVVAGKGYLLLDNDFWQYDPKTDMWKKMPDFPGVTRSLAACFTVGDKAYIGTGLEGTGQAEAGGNDLWEYDPATGKWTKRADFPGEPRYGALAFSIGSKGYIGLGNVPGKGKSYNDLWEYDPKMDEWHKKADFPEIGRISPSVFIVNNLAYVMFGDEKLEVTAGKRNIYTYNAVSNIWTKAEDFPGPDRLGATVFSINNKGYVFSGYNGSKVRYHDCWEYEPAGKSWKQTDDTLPNARNDAFCFVIDNAAYMGGGKIKSGLLGSDGSDMWCLSLRTNVNYHAKLLYGDQDGKQKLPLAQQGVSLVSAKKVIQTTTTDNTGAFAFEKVHPDSKYQVVLAKNDKLPANATIAIAKSNGKIVQNLSKNSNGQFAYELSNIDSIDEEDNYFNLQYFIKSSDTATTITTHITYETGSSNLSDDAQTVVYQVIAALDKYPNLKLRISSHTDAVGDPGDNMKLSQDRAKVVVDFIIANGIDAKRVSGYGYGDTKLLNKCRHGVKCSEDDNKVNRRTEFRFIR